MKHSKHQLRFTLVCVTCRQTFKASRADARSCSRSCRDKLRRKLAKRQRLLKAIEQEFYPRGIPDGIPFGFSAIKHKNRSKSDTPMSLFNRDKTP